MSSGPSHAASPVAGPANYGKTRWPVNARQTFRGVAPLCCSLDVDRERHEARSGTDLVVAVEASVPATRVRRAHRGTVDGARDCRSTRRRDRSRGTSASNSSSRWRLPPSWFDPVKTPSDPCDAIGRASASTRPFAAPAGFQSAPATCAWMASTNAQRWAENSLPVAAGQALWVTITTWSFGCTQINWPKMPMPA